MKKIALLILLATLLSLGPVKADEGMWLLPLIEKLNIKKMSQLGFKLSAKDIYDINNSSLKDAVVHFGGGCTAEIISAEGLVLTNHHCGYSAIQKLSTVENDFLQNGYWAMTRQEELPAQGLSVTFLESFTDVTSQIEKATKKAKTPEEQTKAMNAVVRKMKKKAKGNNEFISAEVSSMYGGNSYYLVVSKTYKDIRFVGAPPSSIGKFGADTDNWMWPRHTGDFSLFRVYANANNEPATYSANNKPYTPKKHLTISLKGVEQNDFAMIIGYPGRTSRFMTSAEVVETRDIKNANIIHIRGIRQNILMADMEANPKIRLQYASKYSSSSNFWKKAMGMNETFAKLNVEKRRAAQEEAFTNWIGNDKKRIAKYGNALKDINTAIEQRAEPMYQLRYLQESLGNIEITAIASYYAGIANALKNGDKKKAKMILKVITPRVKNLFINYSASTDRKVAKALIKVYKEKIKPENRPSFYQVIEDEFGGNIDLFVDNMFDKTLFTSYESIEKALENDPNFLINDPAVQTGSSIFASMPTLTNDVSNASKTYAQGHKAYIAGLLEMKKGAPIYPDANSTMRMTYGQVLNYSPRDAVKYDFVTTLTGVMEKEDPNNWEFVVPQKLKELYANKDYGQYAMKNGEMPVGFISNNDITGGNSGSPVLNANGQLIGTAFDGNWEAMSGDIIFEPNLQRCINVDIRYTLFIIDKFGGAKHLIDEMTIVK